MAQHDKNWILTWILCYFNVSVVHCPSYLFYKTWIQKTFRWHQTSVISSSTSWNDEKLRCIVCDTGLHLWSDFSFSDKWHLWWKRGFLRAGAEGKSMRAYWKTNEMQPFCLSSKSGCFLSLYFHTESKCYMTNKQHHFYSELFAPE